MRKLLKKLNLFFFGNERISLPDSIWFYGFFIFIVAIVILLVIVNLQLFLFFK